MTFAEPIAGEDLERALARYARVRLDPSPAQVRRARAAVMEAAWRRHLHAGPARRARARRRGRRTRPIARIPFSGWGVRRVGDVVRGGDRRRAAGRILGVRRVAGRRSALRVAPRHRIARAAGGRRCPGRRAGRHADARLGEAVEAALRHDDAATAAALDAYDRTIDDLATAEGAAGVTALDAVQFHRTVLLQLAAQTSDDAATGLDRALANSTRVIDRLAGAARAATAPAASMAAPGRRQRCRGRERRAPGRRQRCRGRWRAHGGEQGGGGTGTGTNGEPQGGQGGQGGDRAGPEGHGRPGTGRDLDARAAGQDPQAATDAAVPLGRLGRRGRAGTPRRSNP